MTEAERFPVFVLVTLAVFVLILRVVMRKRASRPSLFAMAAVSCTVVIGGMMFAKIGNNSGWPWWIYYTVPALVTLALPPMVFRFSVTELWQYVILAFLASPLIHVVFSFFFGWHEYMPFLHVPSMQD